MDIAGFFNSLYSNTVPFIILLGALIFVHELGHFLVAKFYKVKVEVFSMGFGKKILQYKYGDTTYCISIVPLGGYVKMFGDDPRAEISESEKAGSFLHKPLWPRTAVVLAGPLMNFFFAIFVFAVVAFLGDQQVEPIVGDISAQSEAAKAGLMPGDKIISVSEKKIRSWKEFTDSLEDLTGQSTRLEVKSGNGNLKTITVIPELIENPDLLSSTEKVGGLKGLTNISKSTAVAVDKPNSPAAAAGLRTHDIVMKVNGKDVLTWRDFSDQVAAARNELSLEVYRYTLDGEHKEILNFKFKQKSFKLTSLGIESAELYISRVVKDSPAEKAGIKSNDKVSSINGRELTRWMGLLETVKAYKENDPPLKFKVVRGAETLDISVTPQLTKQQGAKGQQEQRYTVGIVPTLLLDTVPPVVMVKANSWGEAISTGWSQTIWWTKSTFVVFKKIFEAKISPKNIGGIISIQQAAKKTYDYGMSVFIKMMGILSVNLFVMNLLPVPVLDGGHLVFYFIELVKGSPLSVKKMELATQIGLFLLLGLMVFAIFNDINMVFRFNW